MKVKRARKRVKQAVYCGPAALSSLLGVTADSIIKAIREYRGNGAIVATTYSHELRAAVRWFGGNVEAVDTDGATLNQLAEVLPFNRSHLILIRGHWVALHGRMVVDSTHPDGIPVSQYRRNRSRVREAYAVMNDAVKPERHFEEN